MKNTVQYLTNLTPMRGIAALLIVIFHIDLMMGMGQGLLIRHSDSLVLTKMFLMVDFFFILSGFIMCHVYATWFKETISGNQYKKFTIARFARVYPMHLVTLLYTIVLFKLSGILQIPKVPVLQVADTNFSIFTNLFLVQSMNLHNWFTWNHASWSISTEWWAYMLFPFLVKPFLKLKPITIIIVVALCFIGYLAITYLLVPLVTSPPEIPFVKIQPGTLTINVAYQFGFIRCLCGFILGMAMYQCYKIGWGAKILGNGYTIVLITLAIFTSMHFDLPDFVTVTLFPFLLLSGTYGSINIDKLFNLKPLQRLGDWSFSIYIIHEPLLYTLGNIMTYLHPVGKTIQASPPPTPDMLTAWTFSIIFISIILLIASLTYRFIEVPTRNWINGKNKKDPGLLSSQ